MSLSGLSPFLPFGGAAQFFVLQLQFDLVASI
jgi:hypothetical protein